MVRKENIKRKDVARLLKMIGRPLEEVGRPSRWVGWGGGQKKGGRVVRKKIGWRPLKKYPAPVKKRLSQKWDNGQVA